jgi:hypothetical protein
MKDRPRALRRQWANLDAKIHHFSGHNYGHTKEGIHAAKNEKHP